MHIYQTINKYNYQGLTQLGTYIIGCNMNDREGNKLINYHTSRELHTFLTLSFTKLHTLKYEIDKGVSLTNSYITGFPSIDKSKSDLILFLDQENSDKLFMISYIQLSKIYTQLKELTEFKSFNQNDFFKSMECSYLFVDQLYDESLKFLNNHECDECKEKPDEIANPANTANTAKSIKQLEEENINENKFDKSNYIQL